MPLIEISYKDLCKLIGKQITVDKLRDDILYAKGEIEEQNGDSLKVDVKDTNRPDLWSTEGIAREIKGRYGKVGLIKYNVSRSNVVVKVDNKVSRIRPKIVCAIIRNIKIDKNVLSQLIQLQEKVSLTFGRNRKEVAIGVYDLCRAKPPIRYTTVKPTGIKFVPLEFEEKMTPKDILEKHPKGREFSYLLEGCKEYPILIDAAGEVLSMPPIINSNFTGKVTEKTKDLFIECTGFNLKFLLPALNVIVAAMADRGAKIESVKVAYPNKNIVTPNLDPRSAWADIDYINKMSGLALDGKQISKLLEQARYKTYQNRVKNRIDVLYPAYRQDIMHQRDIVEDVIISYGYNNIDPQIPKLATKGSESRIEIFSNNIAEIMIGLGLQEILNYTLTNKKNLFDRMNLDEQHVAEIENPVSSNWCVFRNWLLPGMLEFLSNNKHVDYPQNIFEIGDCVMIDDKEETRSRDVRRLSAVLTDNIVNYDHISSYLDSLFSNLGLKYKLKKSEHPSFIHGRTASIILNNQTVGVIGEISPDVLCKWDLEKPVIGFELNINKIHEMMK